MKDGENSTLAMAVNAEKMERVLDRDRQEIEALEYLALHEIDVCFFGIQSGDYSKIVQGHLRETHHSESYCSVKV